MTDRSNVEKIPMEQNPPVHPKANHALKSLVDGDYKVNELLHGNAAMDTIPTRIPEDYRIPQHEEGKTSGEVSGTVGSDSEFKEANPDTGAFPAAERPGKVTEQFTTGDTDFEGDIADGKDGDGTKKDLSTTFSTLSIAPRYMEINKMYEVLNRYKGREERLMHRLHKLDADARKDYAIPEYGDDVWGIIKPVNTFDDRLSQYFEILFMNTCEDNKKELATEEEISRTINMVTNGDECDVLIDKFDIEITRNAIYCLEGSNWLDDEIINFYFQMLQERNENYRANNVQNVPNCYFFNTFFFTALCGGNMLDIQYNYRTVARWTKRKKVNVFEKDMLLVPIHVSNNHWALGVVEMRKDWRRLMLFDSLGGDNKMWFLNIRRWLQDEHLDKLNSSLESIDDWVFRDDFQSEPYAPEQHNCHDCGVFLCQYAECIAAARRFDFSQKHIENLRVKMMQQIINGAIDA